MTDAATREMPVDFLACSNPGRLLRVRRNEWLPCGARVARGGIARSYAGELLAWIAYADRADTLACPSWPQQAMELSLDQVFPAGAEVDVLYRGGDARRATVSVNARLAAECGVGHTRVDHELVDHARVAVGSAGHLTRLAG
jgi:hypothetical protein